MLFLGYTGTSFLSTGESYNMDSIAAVVVGGTKQSAAVLAVMGNDCRCWYHDDHQQYYDRAEHAGIRKKMVQGAIIIVLLLSVYGKKSKDN